MKLKTHLAALALCFAVPMAIAAAPICDKDRSSKLGGLAPSGPMGFSSSFSSEGTYRDCFTFSLASQADSLSGVLQFDVKNPAQKIEGIDLKSVALYRGGYMVGEDTSPLLFSFGSLAASGAAVYTLRVESDVTKDWGSSDKPRVGYIGKITTVAAPAPEPAAYALAVMGLIVVGAAALRSKPR